MSVPDAAAAAAGLEPDAVQGLTETLAAAGLWPAEGEAVEPGHTAALLIAILATPEVVRAVASLPFADAEWANVLDWTECRDFYKPGDETVAYFTTCGTFGRVLTCAIEDYRAGDDPWLAKICAGKISVGFTADAWFAEFEVDLRLETERQARGVYRFRYPNLVSPEAGKLVRRAELPIEILQDLGAALEGQVPRSAISNDQPAVLLH